MSIGNRVRKSFVFVLLACLTSLLLTGDTSARIAAAQGTGPPSLAVQRIPGDLVTLRDSGITEQSKITPPPARPGVSTQSSTFTVTYSGFTPEAQAAFQAAVDIWQTQVSSSVPITVDANFEVLGTGILGSAGATFLYRDFAGAPLANTYYPSALANQLHGARINSAASDITAHFNSS